MQNGFTLLEVMVAVLILALSYVAVLQSFSISLKNINKVSKARNVLFSELLAFSKDIRFSGLDPLEDEKIEGNGPLFLQGEKYRLIIVKSESGELVTLKVRSNL